MKAEAWLSGSKIPEPSSRRVLCVKCHYACWVSWPRVPLLFCDDVLRCGGGGSGRGRDRKCQPGISAGRSIHRAKFSIGFDVDVTLEALAQRNDVAKLRTDAEYPRLETPDTVA